MRLGYWASIATCIASLGYAIPQILQVIGILPDPIDRILIFAPSLVLAPCFVVTLAAAYESGSAGQRPLRLAALAIGILYAGLASIVYINQLGVVIPREMTGDAAGYSALACCGFRQPTTVLDLLGYTYMSIATALLGLTYRGAVRRLLLLNGAFAVPIFLQLGWPIFIWAAAPWLIIFPLAMAALARSFAEEAQPA